MNAKSIIVAIEYCTNNLASQYVDFYKKFLLKRRIYENLSYMFFIIFYMLFIIFY
jgi:hypothetical protein